MCWQQASSSAWPLGGQAYTVRFVLYKSSADAARHDRLIVDLNRNEKLDDAPVEADAQGCFDFTFPAGEGPVLVRMQSKDDLEVNSGLALRPKRARRGTIKFDGKRVPVVVAKATLGMSWERGDVAAFDLNGNDTFEADECVTLDTWTTVGGKLCRVHADAPGRKLTLQHYTGKMAALRVTGLEEATDCELTVSLHGRWMNYRGSATADKPVTVPAGTWSYVYLAVSRNDEMLYQEMLREYQLNPGETTVAIAAPALQLSPRLRGRHLRVDLRFATDRDGSVWLGMKKAEPAAHVSLYAGDAEQPFATGRMEFG
jgi:hypothetical protein